MPLCITFLRILSYFRAVTIIKSVTLTVGVEIFRSAISTLPFIYFKRYPNLSEMKFFIVANEGFD